jgi:hypothetical protein
MGRSAWGPTAGVDARPTVFTPPFLPFDFCLLPFDFPSLPGYAALCYPEGSQILSVQEPL